MNDRRVLTWAKDEAQALKRLESYPGARVEQLKGGQWAVTAAKKKEGRA